MVDASATAIDISSAMRATENSLRDLIQELLRRQFGENWENAIGVSDERIQEWKDRRIAECAKLSTGTLESRLLYFADFTDLKKIICKNWDSSFKEVFDDKKELEVFLSKLEDFRNPDAHRRGLSQFQGHLALGISGELRTKIARYRSRRDTANDCFPRIEQAFDNFGSRYPHDKEQVIPRLRVGDRIEITINAIDPEDMPLEFAFSLDGGRKWETTEWSTSNQFSLELAEIHICRRLEVLARIRSPRPYHATHECDDSAIFEYEVLPNNRGRA